MKFVVSSSNLLNHSQAISRVINSKKTLSILDCFLLELKGNALSLTAADNESRLQTTIDVSNEGSDGSVDWQPRRRAQGGLSDGLHR